MKTQYITSDGKIFDVKDEAEKYEAELKQAGDAKKILLDKIEAIDKKIDAVKEEGLKLIGEKNALLDEFKEKFMTPEQQKLADSIVSFFERIFDDID